MSDDSTIYQPTPWFKKKKIVIPLILIALSALGSFGGNNSKSNQSSSSDGVSSLRSYPATIEGSAVVNPATLAIRFTVRNDGSQPVTPNCDLRAKDVSGTYSGFDLFTPTTPIEPGGMQHLVGHLTITKQGAQYATDMSISCTANTTDSSSSSNKEVTVVGVDSCGGTYGDYDADNKTWYWGVCAKASGVSIATQMNCTESGLDSSGKVIVSHDFIATTLNDLTITGYGPNETTMPDTTKQIAKAIKSATVKCKIA